jgi:hypothetical protein
MNSVLIVLPNGLALRGTKEQIIEVAQVMGYNNPFLEDYYDSSSKGLIRIDEMETVHLRNAIIKMLREDPNTNDKTWRAMVKEYLKREIE